MKIINVEASALSTIARIANEHGVGTPRPNPDPVDTVGKRTPPVVHFPQPETIREIFEAYNKAYEDGSDTESSSSSDY